jgi:hypothetical protein
MATLPGSLTCRVAPHEPTLRMCVESAARATNRPFRPLHLQALLQLPRVADECGFVSIPVVNALLTELAEELPVAAEWFVSDAGPSPRSLRFSEIAPASAHDVMQRFHYLRSPRTDGRAYGLSTAAGSLVALCVSSPLDVGHLYDLLVTHGRASQLARVVSRVFVFEGAPSNCISYLLSRATGVERRFGVTDFVTYVNPNLGFTGSSYRASGWQLLGDEPGTTYRYLDGRYTTDRRLASEFGKHNDATYRRLLGYRFAVSAMPLAPLLVFHAQLI